MLLKATYLNQKVLRLLDGLIIYKERILHEVVSCNLYTANYPLLIEHILREARWYRDRLLDIENGCQIRSVILPLLADHVLREANHYLRLLTTCPR